MCGFLARVLAVSVASALLLGACSHTPSGPYVVVHGQDGGAATVTVELALTKADQARGLMFRTKLAQNAGMLFVFPNNRRRSFWMKNTPLPLDIIYIRQSESDGGRGDGTIVHIAKNTSPYSETALPSLHPARYVLEVNGGFCDRHGIGDGNRVELARALNSGGSGKNANNHR